jgi:hypothetical protein
MLSAPAHQIVLVVNGIYLLENLKLGDAVARNAYEFTFRITLPLFLLHSGPALGRLCLSATAPWSTWRGLSKAAAAPSLSPRGRQRAAWPKAELNVAGGPRVRIRFPPLASQAPGWRPLAWGNGFPRLQRINARESLLSRDQPNLW